MGGGGRNFSNPNKAGATSFGQASENFGYSAVRLKRVKKLQFGVINPDELVSNKFCCWKKSWKCHFQSIALYVSLSPYLHY